MAKDSIGNDLEPGDNVLLRAQVCKPNQHRAKIGYDEVWVQYVNEVAERVVKSAIVLRGPLPHMDFLRPRCGVDGTIEQAAASFVMSVDAEMAKRWYETMVERIKSSVTTQPDRVSTYVPPAVFDAIKAIFPTLNHAPNAQHAAVAHLESIIGQIKPLQRWKDLEAAMARIEQLPVHNDTKRGNHYREIPETQTKELRDIVTESMAALMDEMIGHREHKVKALEENKVLCGTIDELNRRCEDLQAKFNEANNQADHWEQYAAGCENRLIEQAKQTLAESKALEKLTKQFETIVDGPFKDLIKPTRVPKIGDIVHYTMEREPHSDKVHRPAIVVSIGIHDHICLFVMTAAGFTLVWMAEQDETFDKLKNTWHWPEV